MLHLKEVLGLIIFARDVVLKPMLQRMLFLLQAEGRLEEITLVISAFTYLDLPLNLTLRSLVLWLDFFGSEVIELFIRRRCMLCAYIVVDNDSLVLHEFQDLAVLSAVPPLHS